MSRPAYFIAFISIIAVLQALGGCAAATYQVPGRAADFNALGITPETIEIQTDAPIAQRLDRKPLATFPAAVAVARVQGRGYQSYTATGHGQGDFTIVTTRDVEDRVHFERIASMPMIRALLPINRLVAPTHIRKELDLREAAAAVNADMLLIYTFDTRFHIDTTVPALGTLTLGAFPNRRANVTTTASAALLDTRNGYVYGLAESTARRDRTANAWFSEQSVDRTRREAEAEAFAKLLDEVQLMWSQVVAGLAPPVRIEAKTPVPSP
jgi:hypothetical protein